MPHAAHHPAPPTASASSLLGSALLRLDEAIRRSRESDRRTEELFRDWQIRWDAQRSRMADRLRAIDARLYSLDSKPTPAPRLNLVGVPADGATMSPMGG
jgi:hypothetical protein